MVPGLYLWAEIFFISGLLELLGLLFFCGYIWWGYISGFLVITGIMSTSNIDVFDVRFIGKNYSTWEFQFRIFVIEKEPWGHIDGSDPAPTEPTKLAQWQVKDARVMTWILASVD